jgi:hypothetical protein
MLGAQRLGVAFAKEVVHGEKAIMLNPYQLGAYGKGSP